MTEPLSQDQRKAVTGVARALEEYEAIAGLLENNVWRTWEPLAEAVKRMHSDLLALQNFAYECIRGLDPSPGVPSLLNQGSLPAVLKRAWEQPYRQIAILWKITCLAHGLPAHRELPEMARAAAEAALKVQAEDDAMQVLATAARDLVEGTRR